MSDSDDETTSDRDTVTTAHGRVRCHWAGFRHGMIQWRRWHWILGTSVVDNRRRGQVAESQMIMAVMWKRKLLGKRWQVIKEKMQDKQEVEDMQCTGMAAGQALKLARKRRQLEEEERDEEQEEYDEATGVASVLGQHEGKKATKRRNRRKKRTRKSRARAASSRLTHKRERARQIR